MDCSPPDPSAMDSPGKNTGVGCYALLQGIFLTQGSNRCLLHLLHWQEAGGGVIYHERHLGSPIRGWVPLILVGGCDWLIWLISYSNGGPGNPAISRCPGRPFSFLGQDSQLLCSQLGGNQRGLKALFVSSRSYTVGLGSGLAQLIGIFTLVVGMGTMYGAELTTLMGRSGS